MEQPGVSGVAFGSFTTEIHEPCQVRNEAALSGTFRVLKGCWIELTASVTSVDISSKPDARLLLLKCYSSQLFRNVRQIRHACM